MLDDQRIEWSEVRILLPLGVEKQEALSWSTLVEGDEHIFMAKDIKI